MLKVMLLYLQCSNISSETETASTNPCSTTQSFVKTAQAINGMSVVHCLGGDAYYGRPLSVSGRPCYVLPMFLPAIR